MKKIILGLLIFIGINVSYAESWVKCDIKFPPNVKGLKIEASGLGDTKVGTLYKLMVNDRYERSLAAGLSKADTKTAGNKWHEEDANWHCEASHQNKLGKECPFFEYKEGHDSCTIS